MKALIVNADDFGHSAGVNRGIVQAHKEGIVTSASLMVLRPAAAEAVALSKATKTLDLGLHIDLGEWIFAGGAWTACYQVVPLQSSSQVEEEVWRQISIFTGLTGRDPSHLDSHQHVHLRPVCKPVVERIGGQLAVPVRGLNPGIHYCGEFYGQSAQASPLPSAISVTAMLQILAKLPEGITELVCHPGHANGLGSPYRMEREQELTVLCDPRVRAAIEALGVTLCSFQEILC